MSENNSNIISSVAAGAEELNEIFQAIMPWAIEYKNSKELLKDYTLNSESEIDSYLGEFYLFKVCEISITSGLDNLNDEIFKRHLSIITACYHSEFSLATIITGKGGGLVDIYLAVKGAENQVPEIFESLLKGAFPGKGVFQKIEKSSERIIRSQLFDKCYGGIISGIPSLKVDGEKKYIDISSVIRSLNDKKYIIVMASNPIPKYEAANYLQKLMKMKDRCHALANRSISLDETTVENGSKTNTESSGSSSASGSTKTGGLNFAPTISNSLNASGAVTLTYGNYIPFVGFGAVSFTGTIGATIGGALTFGGMGSYSQNKTHTTSLSNSEAETVGWNKSTGKQLSYDQQNSLAIELESAAGKLIKRVRTGLNNGLWESFISFAAKDETTSKIIIGSFCGELIKADPDALPLKVVSSELSSTTPFFIPRERSDLEIQHLDNKLFSFLSSDELSILMSIPHKPVPGYDIKLKPQLSLTDTTSQGFSIGVICEHGTKINNSSFHLSHADINKHIFIAGLTGSGKTTTVKELLSKANRPFLVLESAKREYRRLLSNETYGKFLDIYTVGEPTISPVRHNPFWVVPNISVITHIDNLKSIFNASFSMYGPMPYILEKCLANIYKHKGWNLTAGTHSRVKILSVEDSLNNRFIYPKITDLKYEITRYVEEELNYSGELKDNIRTAIISRIDSLCVGSKGFIYNTHDFINIEDLLNSHAVFELESLADDDDKAFFVGLIITLISEYRQALSRNASTASDNDKLKHILVIEEAHRLLRNVNTEKTSEMLGNPKGKAVEFFCNIMSEMRSFGQGIIVAEQIPTKICPDVIKNTNTKIIHRLVSHDEQLAISAGIDLLDEECRYLCQLSSGFALVHKEGMSKPVEVCVNNLQLNGPIDDLRIKSIGHRLCKGLLDEKISLHESGLLDCDHFFAISIRFFNTFFVSDFTLKDVLSAAVNSARFLSDNIHEESVLLLALKENFTRILFSKTYNLCNSKLAAKIEEIIGRVWSDENYTCRRFMKSLNDLAGINSKELVLNRIATIVARDHLRTKQSFEILLNNVFLLDDASAKRSLIVKLKECGFDNVN